MNKAIKEIRRVSGVILPDQKRLVIALTYVFGIGHTRAQLICKSLGFEDSIRTNQLSEDDLNRINDFVDKNYTVESDLKRDISLSVKRLININCYRGMRRQKGLPSRGQRTNTNAKTCKKIGRAFVNTKSSKK